VHFSSDKVSGNFPVSAPSICPSISRSFRFFNAKYSVYSTMMEMWHYVGNSRRMLISSVFLKHHKTGNKTRIVVYYRTQSIDTGIMSLLTLRQPVRCIYCCACMYRAMHFRLIVFRALVIFLLQLCFFCLFYNFFIHPVWIIVACFVFANIIPLALVIST